MDDQRDFAKLLAYLRRVPAVSSVAFGTGTFEDGNWWVKFSLDLPNPLAWHVVQELACVLNYLSATDRLPVLFMPVSPAPYINGGPEDCLSWVIESKDPNFKPDTAAEWLLARLPNPVDDLAQWGGEDDA